MVLPGITTCLPGPLKKTFRAQLADGVSCSYKRLFQSAGFCAGESSLTMGLRNFGLRAHMHFTKKFMTSSMDFENFSRRGQRKIEHRPWIATGNLISVKFVKYNHNVHQNLGGEYSLYQQHFSDAQQRNMSNDKESIHLKCVRILQIYLHEI